MTTAAVVENPLVDAVVAQLAADDVLGQLIDGRGDMSRLASEAGVPMLDWVCGMDRWLGDAEAPARLDDLVASVLRGSGELVWSGMGGSVLTAKVMLNAGVLAGAAAQIHPLDSTDPAALNALLRTLRGPAAAVGVSMGMTSEEPLTHLRWLRGVPGVTEAESVMTIPGSVLEHFALEAGIPLIGLQPDGGACTPGRFSAPGTHAFLIPAAIALGGAEMVRDQIARANDGHGIRAGMTPPERRQLTNSHPAIRLAADLHVHLQAGRDKALVVGDPATDALAPWVEQLVEESLGKGGRGLLVFPSQRDHLLSAPPPDCFLLNLSAAAPGAATSSVGGFAQLFAGWALAVAVLGYLEKITFAGQPAVEAYKRYARELRESPEAIPMPSGATIARAGERVRLAADDGRLGYLDITLNAAEGTAGWAVLASAARTVANIELARPVKTRIAPAHYHSTEQAQVDGPGGVHSLRLLLRETEEVSAGEYSHKYLHAQAIGAARAMADAGRPVDLIVLQDPSQLDELTRVLW